MEEKISYPKIYPTVDIALIKDGNVLLGRKGHQKLFRFVGGHVDITDESYEAAAIREVKEETGLNIKNPLYITSRTINDPRYDGITEGIKSILYYAQVDHFDAQALDDIVEVRWFSLKDLKLEHFVEEHQKIAQYFIMYMIAMNRMEQIMLKG